MYIFAGPASIFANILKVKQAHTAPIQTLVFSWTNGLRFSSYAVTKQEWMTSQQEQNYMGGPPPPLLVLAFITCSLILLLCSHKHDTKPEDLLFIVHRGRWALSWMGWFRYVLPFVPRWGSAERRPAWQQGPQGHIQGPGALCIQAIC